MNKVIVGLIVFSVGLMAAALLIAPARADEWIGLRIRNDSYIYSLFQPIDLDTLNLTLRNRVTLPIDYKYNLTICNLTSLERFGFEGVDLSRSNGCTNTLINLGRNTLNRGYNLEIPLAGAFLIKLGNGTEETVYTSEYNEDDTSSVLCADNQTYYYNTSIPTQWEVNNETATINGSWYETRLTYISHPECTTFDPQYEINFTCLIEKCSQIVKLNTLTGNYTTIWQTGDIW